MLRTTLADGTEVFCIGRNEARVLDGHVAGYLAHGITVSPGDVVFDIGSNIGLFSLRTYMRCDADVTIFAFEPIPAIFEVATRNLARCDASRVRVLPYGISERRSTAEFTYFPRAPSLSTGHPELLVGDTAKLAEHVRGSVRNLPDHLWWARWLPGPICTWIAKRLRGAAVEVECELRTVSDVIEEYDVARIDLLKIDNEGAELAALEGVRSAHWPRIQQVVAEVHDTAGRLAAMQAILSAHGLTEVIVDQEPGFEGLDLYNLYARRPAHSDRTATP